MYKLVIVFTLLISFSVFSKDTSVEVLPELNQALPNLIGLKAKNFDLNFWSLKKYEKFTTNKYDIKLLKYLKSTASSKMQKIPLCKVMTGSFRDVYAYHDFYYRINPYDKTDVLIVPLRNHNLIFTAGN